MQYRVLGKIDPPVSVLGFGAMRLPTRGDESQADQDAEAEVSMVLGGMNRLDHLQQNLASVERAAPGSR